MEKRTCRAAIAAVIVTLAASAPLATAQISGTLSRADDGGIWHYRDNPALMAPGADWDDLAAGLAYEAYGPAGESLRNGDSGAIRMAAILPFVGYLDLELRGTTFDFIQGTGLSFGRAFSFGYDVDISSTGALSTFEIGALFRPASFVSTGLTLTLDEIDGAYDAGLGLALRPLAMAGAQGALARSVTLDGDISWSPVSGFDFEDLGLRLLLGGIVDLRTWFALSSASIASGSIGLELRMALGPTEFSASTPAVQSLQGAWSAAEEVKTRLSDFAARPRPFPSSSLGRRVLVIKDLAAVDPDRPTELGLGGLLSAGQSMTFSELMSLLEAVRRDASVPAVALENFPPIAGAAYYQELADELASLRRAGKKVYLYGDDFGLELSILSPCVDRISLNPLGAVSLAGLGYHRAYLKGFFDKLGVRFVNLAPWATKSAYNDFTEDAMPAAEETMMRRFIGDAKEQFAASLGSGRGGRLTGGADSALAGAPYLEGSAALSAGLVDELAYAGEFEDAVRKASGGARLVSGLGEPLGQDWGSRAFAKKAAVVWLSGTIGIGSGRAGQEIGTSAAREIERLRKDSSVAGIILRIDSGGGYALTSDVIAREVRLAVQAKKPVAVSMGHYAASGAYYIAAPASWIVAEPMTITGSIGVTGLVPNFAQALRKLGIEYDGFDLAPGSSFLDPGKPLDEAELAKTRNMIVSIYNRFVGVVAEGRHMEESAVRKIAEGQIWTGREAKDRGLVDQLGGLSETKAWLEAKVGARLDYVDVVPGDQPAFLASLEGLASAIGTAAEGKDTRLLQDTLRPAALELQRLADLGQGPLYCIDTEASDF